VSARQSRENHSVRAIISLPHGTIVSRADDGAIYVTGSQGARPIDLQEPVGLLPLLELGPDSLSAEAAATLPIPQVLTLALTWGSKADHRPRLAVEWLTKTGVSDDVRAALAAFAHSDRGSQQTRHAARRLLRTNA
jgi:hypothetical protein